ncbi:hypothetical protein Leryth_016217 [Lithospermum erythrorhizon]|nr:hypothetical protein Leryth_016217 [Lithospermum erythrorhizon]
MILKFQKNSLYVKMVESLNMKALPLNQIRYKPGPLLDHHFVVHLLHLYCLQLSRKFSSNQDHLEENIFALYLHYRLDISIAVYLQEIYRFLLWLRCLSLERTHAD